MSIKGKTSVLYFVLFLQHSLVFVSGFVYSFYSTPLGYLGGRRGRGKVREAKYIMLGICCFCYWNWKWTELRGLGRISKRLNGSTGNWLTEKDGELWSGVGIGSSPKLSWLSTHPVQLKLQPSLTQADGVPSSQLSPSYVHIRHFSFSFYHL